MRALRDRLTYANVMATLAVFIALGGSSYAVSKLDGKRIENGTIAGKKLKRNTLGGREIREGRLGKVRRSGHADRASGADRLNGLTASQLKLGCPGDTAVTSGLCIETAARSPLTYLAAITSCQNAQRRVPTHGELTAFLGRPDAEVASGGELTSSVAESRANPGQLDVTVVTDDAGGVTFQSAASSEARAFRCVTTPTN